MLPALVASLAAFVAGVGVHDARSRARRHAAADLVSDTTIMRAGVNQGTVRRALIPEGKGQSVSPEELRRRVKNLALGTYVGDILAEQDSALYTWPEHLANAMRVYVSPTSSIAGFDAHYPQMARDVFGEWGDAGFPLRFTFIYDSSSADITVGWVERFGAEEGQRIGVTERVQTSAFRIARASVSVANHDSTGRLLSAMAVGGILRHEIGHALGLNHANDPTSVMYRESASSTIGVSDRATLRLLYLVPPGSLKN